MIKTQKQIEQTLDSREVAEMVGKKHYNLIRDIKGYVEELGELKIEFTDFLEKILTKRSKTKRCLVMISQRKAASS